MNNPSKPVIQSCKDAVMAELVAAGATPAIPIDLYLIGPTLVAAGFTERQIVNTLDSLEYPRRIEFTGANRVRVTQAPR
ncbi:MAG TPA: hypothetical protein VGN93_01650 [Shinella sp.]|jgi:hypothetical protein|uniref:hypothetical protein n=1 Tax=Shinella sp. TaxID=1870904 RepID=UPI002E0D228F|nr:hypothetical protein [Shinella sp.]